MSSGAVAWITGLPSSGKSKLARAVKARLTELGVACCMLDGDEVRKALVPTPGYDARARAQFYETLGNLAGLLAAQGAVVLVPATAHRREFRDYARSRAERFFEVWVNVPLEVVRSRDSKGLYREFASGQARDVPGEDAPYEPPANPDVVAGGGADEAAREALVALLTERSRP
jgi:adenylylsulfate kinase